MPAPVAECPDHGYVEGERCPHCDASTRGVLSGPRRRQLSKYLSGALRHFPEDAGITLDGAGWTPFADLVTTADEQYDWADRTAVAAVVATDPKGRFERNARDGTAFVRAAYGHSVDVDPDRDHDRDASETSVPDTLYHGTAPRNLDAILSEGLKPMNRQRVHLSETVADAREVGSRHADDPVVLAVDAAALQERDHDVTKRGQSVFTTDHVPPDVLSVFEA